MSAKGVLKLPRYTASDIFNYIDHDQPIVASPGGEYVRVDELRKRLGDMSRLGRLSPETCTRLVQNLGLTDA